MSSQGFLWILKLHPEQRNRGYYCSTIPWQSNLGFIWVHFCQCSLTTFTVYDSILVMITEDITHFISYYHHRWLKITYFHFWWFRFSRFSVWLTECGTAPLIVLYGPSPVIYQGFYTADCFYIVFIKYYAFYCLVGLFYLLTLLI